MGAAAARMPEAMMASQIRHFTRISFRTLPYSAPDCPKEKRIGSGRFSKRICAGGSSRQASPAPSGNGSVSGGESPQRTQRARRGKREEGVTQRRQDAGRDAMECGSDSSRFATRKRSFRSVPARKPGAPLPRTKAAAWLPHSIPSEPPRQWGAGNTTPAATARCDGGDLSAPITEALRPTQACEEAKQSARGDGNRGGPYGGPARKRRFASRLSGALDADEFWKIRGWSSQSGKADSSETVRC